MHYYNRQISKKERESHICWDEPTRYLGEDDDKYFAVLYKDANHVEQEFVKTASFASWFIKNKKNFAKKDVYISQACFCNNKSRRLNNVASLSLAFLDLDYYKCQDLAHLKPEEIADKFLEACLTFKVPLPSYVVYSGRGLQVKWLFSSAIGRDKLAIWNELERAIVKKFEAFGSDAAACDAARVLRVVGSTNSKSSEKCRIVRENLNVQALPTRYSFEELCTAFDITNQSKTTDTSEKSSETSSTLIIEQLPISRSEKKRPNEFKGFQKLAFLRYRDLLKLISLRKGLPEGMRMNGVFYVMNFMSLAGLVSEKDFFVKAAEIAHQIDPTFLCKKGDLQALFERMRKYHNGEKVVYFGKEKVPLFTPKTKKLIQIFSISEEEMQSLKTLISDAVRLRRQAKKKRESRENAGIDPRSEYLLRARARKERAQFLYAEGHSKTSIAEMMGMSRRQIQNYLKSSGEGCEKCVSSSEREAPSSQAKLEKKSSRGVQGGFISELVEKVENAFNSATDACAALFSKDLRFMFDSS